MPLAEKDDTEDFPLSDQADKAEFAVFAAGHLLGNFVEDTLDLIEGSEILIQAQVVDVKSVPGPTTLFGNTS